MYLYEIMYAMYFIQIEYVIILMYSSTNFNARLNIQDKFSMDVIYIYRHTHIYNKLYVSFSNSLTKIIKSSYLFQ